MESQNWSSTRPYSPECFTTIESSRLNRRRPVDFSMDRGTVVAPFSLNGPQL